MLTGIRVEILGEMVVLAATDRFLPGCSGTEVSASSPDIEGQSGSRPRRGRGRQSGHGGSDVRLSLGTGPGWAGDARSVSVGNGKRSTTRLPDAEFPVFGSCHSTEHTSGGHHGTWPLIEAIKLVALVADRGAGAHGAPLMAAQAAFLVVPMMLDEPRKILLLTMPVNH